MTVVKRTYGALAAEERVRGAVVGHDGRALERAGGREHVVGKQSRGRHPVLHGDEELHLLQGLKRHLRIAVGVHRVGGVHDEAANLIGVAGNDGLEDAGAVGLTEPLGRQRFTPGTLGVVGDQRVAGPARQLEFIGADLLGLLLLGQALVGLHLLVSEEVQGRPRHAVAPGHVQIAADGAHEGQREARRRGGGAELVPGAAPLDAAGLVAGVHAGRRADLVRGQPRERRGPFRRVVTHVLLQGVEVLAPVAHEGEVVKALVDDSAQHGQGQSRIGAGAQRQPQIGLRRRLGVARVHHDDLHARLLQVGVAAHGAQR